MKNNSTSGVDLPPLVRLWRWLTPRKEWMITWGCGPFAADKIDEELWPRGGKAFHGVCLDCGCVENDCRCSDEGAGCKHCGGNLDHAPWCPSHIASPAIRQQKPNSQFSGGTSAATVVRRKITRIPI